MKWIIAAVVLLALAGAGAGGWFGCLIPGFGPDTCKGEASSPPVAEKPAEPPAPSASAEPTSCADISDAEACYKIAKRLQADKKLEEARQALQQAAALGSSQANIAVAEMYDPRTFSPETSAVAKPNWETAVYWYEKAAGTGNAQAQFAAGALLCQYALTDFEKTQGRAHLTKAASAGIADAQRLLSECK